MDSRELYPSDEQRRRIMDFIMAAGETLLENGAEVFRVDSLRPGGRGERPFPRDSSRGHHTGRG